MLLGSTLAVVVALSAVTVGWPSGARAAVGDVVEYSTGLGGGTDLQGIAAGPAGTLWVADRARDVIVRITTAGVISVFSTGITRGSAPQSITLGSDGNLWFTEPGHAALGQITPTGTIQEFPTNIPGSVPQQITSGPDGNLWFTDTGTSSIGRMTIAGVVKEFATPTTSSLEGITAGVDGRIWFVENAVNKIARITTAGVITVADEFTIPTPTSSAYGIGAGSDGNLWFTENLTNKIGRITTAGVITAADEFPVLSGANPLGIATGPDGDLWFAESGTSRIGRMSTVGTVLSEYPTLTPASAPTGISAGSDGNLWFSENSGEEIGRIEAPAASGPDLTVAKTGPATTSGGVPITYTITVTNHGPGSASPLLVDVLKSNGVEAGSAFGVVTTTQGVCSNVAGRIVCDLGSMTSGVVATVHVTVTPPTVGTLINNASVDTAGDPNPTDNSSTVTTTVAGVASLLLTPSPDKVWANGHEQTTLTGTLLDAGGHPVAHQSVLITASPGNGVTMSPKRAQLTDGSGHVHVTATSTTVGDVVFTAAVVSSHPSVSGSATVHFVRHKVVMELQGIRSSLQCTFATRSICTGADLFDPVHLALPAPYYQPSDFIDFSYQGGKVDSATGRWRTKNYSCKDTAQSYETDIKVLHKTVIDYASANPNTDLYLMGHSQGGLIAFQELGYLDDLPLTVRIPAIITLDSPLGGAPDLDTFGTYLTTCWKGAAPRQLAELSASSGDSQLLQQGDDVTILCGLLKQCKALDRKALRRTLTPTNAQAVSAVQARPQPTRIYTFGNTFDAVYNHTACGLPNLAGDNTSSQVISTAYGSTLSNLGGNDGLPNLAACISDSHAQVVTSKALSIAAIIGVQY
jgi:virginiamycin B lyase